MIAVTASFAATALAQGSECAAHRRHSEIQPEPQSSAICVLHARAAQCLIKYRERLKGVFDEGAQQCISASAVLSENRTCLPSSHRLKDKW